MKVLLIRTMTFLALFIMSACHHRNTDFIDEHHVHKMPCKVKGACDVVISRMLRSFNKRGITVITMGQNYLVSIPACALFADQTPRMTWAGYGLLNEIATFLKQFRKIAVHVTSYSNKYVSVSREQALTLARSRVVGEYLWSQGIDSRFIFTQGLGSDKPVVESLTDGDRGANARVEITFRRAVA